MTYLMRLNQINFGIITPEKDEPSGLNTYSAKHLCLLMYLLCCGKELREDLKRANMDTICWKNEIIFKIAFWSYRNSYFSQTFFG